MWAIFVKDGRILTDSSTGQLLIFGSFKEAVAMMPEYKAADHVLKVDVRWRKEDKF